MNSARQKIILSRHQRSNQKKRWARFSYRLIWFDWGKPTLSFAKYVLNSKLIYYSVERKMTELLFVQCLPNKPMAYLACQCEDRAWVLPKGEAVKPCKLSKVWDPKQWASLEQNKKFSQVAFFTLCHQWPHQAAIRSCTVLYVIKKLYISWSLNLTKK